MTSFSEIEKMDTITKRENCLEDSKLAKQVMMCSCVYWPRDTKRIKSSDGRLLATTTKMKMKNKNTSILRVGTTCACARRPPKNKNLNLNIQLLEMATIQSDKTITLAKRDNITEIGTDGRIPYLVVI